MGTTESPTPVGVVLVAGIGQRLRPLTNDRPKALMDVGGETLLGRTVRLLVEAGVQEIILATGYKEEAIQSAMATCPVPVRYCWNEAFDRTQNSVSLWLCREAIADRPFFKLDGDLLFHPEVLQRLQEPTHGLVAAVDRKASLGEEEMKVLVDGELIRDFGKHLDPKLSYGESIGLERVSGVAVSLIFHALGECVDQGKNDLYYEDVYAQVIKNGMNAGFADVSDLPWSEVDTFQDLEAARALVASGRLSGV
jgi:choline kinase